MATLLDVPSVDVILCDIRLLSFGQRPSDSVLLELFPLPVSGHAIMRILRTYALCSLYRSLKHE